MQSSESATPWRLVLEDLQGRGVEDVLVVCTDNLKGCSEVISDVFPARVCQKCVVHQVRNSCQYVDEKERKAVASDLRKVYSAASREQAQVALDAFGVKWGKKYGYVLEQWQANWDELLACMDFPKNMRRMSYTTNPLEALHRIMRKVVKGKAAWVSETALFKQLYLTLMHNEKSWRRQAFAWRSTQRELLETYPDRIREWIADI